MNATPSTPNTSPAARTTPVRALPVPRSAVPARRLGTSSLGRPPVLDVSHVRRSSQVVPDPRPFGAPAAPAPVLPDPTGICGAVVRTAVEVLRGERPVSQLARWLAPDVYEALGRRARLLRAQDEPRPTLPVSVLRTRTVRLGRSAAETTVVVEDADRVRAAAVRVEVHRGAWRVVALEIG